MALFDASLSSGKYRDTVMQSDAEGRSLGVESIPAFFVNGVKADDKVAGSYDEFAKVIDAELARLGK